MNKQYWAFLPLIVLFVLGVFLYRGLSLKPQELPSTMIGRVAPALPTSRLAMVPNAADLNSKQLLGKVWLLNVWASWCQSCLDEHSVLMTMADSGAVIVGLDYKDSDSDALQWLEQYGSPYQYVASDPNGQAAINWGVYGTPELFIIDKQGKVAYKHIGILTQSIWLNTIKPLLKRLA